MTAINVVDLGFGYAESRLFQGVTFSLEAGERACVVAPNGAGKTTLLRLIAKELAPDEGSITLGKGLRVAYCRQSHELAREGTVLEAFLSGFSDVLQLRHALTDAQHAAASGTNEALSRLSDVTDRYHLAGGDDLERQIDIIASHLGFTSGDMDRSVKSLSGGERGRLQLGVVLAQKADLLLLDEPTNHLDIQTIGWLETHLVGLDSAILCISHDRAFLDAVCPMTMELGHRSFRVYPLKYSDYAVARQEDLARERELVERQEAFVAKTEDFIRRNIAGQKTKQAQSRRKMLEKLEQLERPEDVWQAAGRIRFRFVSAPRSGDIVLDAKGLGATRGEKTLFSDVDLLLRRGDRLGIVGPNGSGKTTLLKLLAGTSEDPMEDTGEIRRGSNLCEGYFDQHLGSLDPDRSAIEEIRSIRGDLNVDATRQYLSRFRFYGDDPFRKVQGLSGGERSRLALAKLLLEPRNLLFLDEPTNHLDIPAAEILEEALINFEGTVILISHDRRFLEQVTTRIVAMQDGQVDIYPGGFRDYQAHVQKLAEKRPDTHLETLPEVQPPKPIRAVRRSASTVVQAQGDSDDPLVKRRAFEAEKAQSRAIDRKKKRIKELETEIEEGESKLTVMRQVLKNDPGGDWEKLATAVAQEQALAKKVDAAMAEWMVLSEELANEG